MRFVFLFLLSLLTIAALPPHGPKYGKYTWYEGLDKAKAENKSFFLYISQKGCPYCRHLDQSLEQNPETVAFLEQNFVLARHSVSTPYGLAVVMDMQLKTTPALVIQHPLSEKEPLILYGITDADTLKTELQKFLASSKQPDTGQLE